ncbi:MAG TPA: hypothetical protein DDW30_03760 [Clostridiales bacterium]|nr:hypothetical protein [Clostridiales bacterium]
MKTSYLNDAFFSRLETCALNLRSDLTGFFGGKHLVKTYGQTVEFADYREYMLGDDIRRIDWNLYSRFEKYFLKLFTDERQMHTQIFLDCSASMGRVQPGKAAYAIAAAAALGFLSVHNTDKVSFKLMRENRAEDPYGVLVGKKAFFRAIASLEQTEFDGETDIAAAVTGCDTGTRDGLTVIISDFLTDSNWKKAVDYLQYKNRQVLLLQVLTPDELDPSYNGNVNLMDAEAVDQFDSRNMRLKITSGMLAAYDEALRDFLADMKSFCSSRDTGYITVNSKEPIERVLFGDLLKVGIMQ